MKSERTSPIIAGNNNIVNIAGGNIKQGEITITVTDNKLSTEQTISQSSNINIVNGLKASEHRFFHHYFFTIELKSKDYSAQAILRNLSEHLNTSQKRDNLLVLRDQYRINVSSGEIRYKIPLYDAGIKSHYKEFDLTLTKNTIHFEYAQYKSNNLLTDMSDELTPFLTMLFFSRKLLGENFNVNVTMQMATNGILVFMPTRNNIINVRRSISSTYILNQDKHSFSANITDIEDNTIMDLMQEIVEGFASQAATSTVPFLTIDAASQKVVLESIKPFLI